MLSFSLSKSLNKGGRCAPPSGRWQTHQWPLLGANCTAALALLPEQAQEEIFRYYFLRQPQRVIGVHIGRTRSTAGRHIQLALKRLRRLMEGKRYE
ncbi:hypothetical protein LKD70_01195 [Ruminococcus sp. CLA-AA-H200]|uniref:Sigma-70 family RNA polymerase sigma factor n=1 Tax=Ruminococcus turbiniformis TaxID=2881258 RepID=A0ABS8FSQ6_9FIRM|nr:hypothetical protein [Ruminococcus turbiniformis]MCC2253068.1 hypothetical protein [Ruminococcus turbiniformis]